MDSDSITNEKSENVEEQLDSSDKTSSDKNYFDGSRYTFLKDTTFDDFETEYKNFCEQIYKESDEDILNKYRYATPIEPQKKKKLAPKILTFLAILGIVLTSVYSIVFVSSMINSKNINNKKLIIEGTKKEDSSIRFQLVATGEWEKTDLSTNKDASLILSSKNRNKGFLVICEGKSELGEDVTLDDYFEAVKSENTQLEEGLEEESIKDITLNNGYNAIQLNVNINHNDEKLKYMIALVETDKSFYQLIGWTTENLYAKSENEFIGMIASFNEF